MAETRKRIHTFTKRQECSYESFLQNLLCLAENLHDEKLWDQSRPIFNLLDEYVTCYHVVYRLGIYKWEGWATEPSRSEGAKLWSDAKRIMSNYVETEHLAAFDMGVLWDRGYPSQDFSRAMKYYKMASERGNAKAKFNIALMYKRGEGVEPSDKIAAKYMEEAAISGHKQATLSIAKYYTSGIGCKQNREKALGYYKMAVDRWDDEYSANKIADWHGKGKVTKDIRMVLRYTKRQKLVEKYWNPVWTEVWPQMTLLKAVIAQQDVESPLHVFPQEVIELFWQDLVSVYFHDKAKLEWSSEKEVQASFR